MAMEKREMRERGTEGLAKRGEGGVESRPLRVSALKREANS